MTVIRPKIELLTNEYKEKIYQEAKAILRTQGVEIENPEARSLLNEEGVENEADRYFIPGDLVDKLRAYAPSEIKLFDREGKEVIKLSQDNIHFDPGSAAIFIQDLKSGNIREALSTDYIKFSKIVDHLPNIDAQSTAIVYSDVSSDAQDWHRLYLALLNCSKPIVTGTFRTESFAIMRNLLELTRTSSDKLAEKPLAIFDACPSPPLMWSNLTTQSVIDASISGIPSEFVSMPLAGSTAPITLIGCVTQHTAECLAGLVIAQLAKRNAPVIWGGSPAVFDMKYGTTPMGAIDTMMINIADVEMGKFLNLPTNAYMSLSDSKVPDAQAGFEGGMGALLAGLTGVNMIAGPGMLDYESTQSFEKLVIDNEIVGMVKRFVQGISDYGEPFAQSILKDYDSNVSLLSHPTTLKLFRKELYLPFIVEGVQIINRETRELWKLSGEMSARQRAKEIAIKLSERSPKHSIDDSLKKELEKIAEKNLN
ncbi:MAG: trimethylamine methyltransferase family protein [Candidatus Heimdallarchaeota archaeon]|nr:MAG: trimethylamine methyltransferase family protein [Candidatus Heimdallarchaeota archaeon]